MQLKYALFFLGLLIFHTNLWAGASPNESPVYMGLGIGNSFLSPNVTEQYSSYQVQQDQDTAFSISLGYAWHRNWVSEFSVFELGQFRLLTDDPVLPPQENIKYQAIGFSTNYYFKEDILRIVGFKNSFNACPPFCNVEPYFLAGMNDLNVKSNGQNVDNNKFYPSLGFGVEFKFTGGLTGRFSYTAFSSDAKVIGVGILARLGKSKKDSYPLNQRDQAEMGQLSQEPSADKESSTHRKSSTDNDPSTEKEPSAEQELLAQKETSTVPEPLAIEAPLAEEVPLAYQKPSADKERSTDSSQQHFSKSTHEKIKDALDRHKLALNAANLTDTPTIDASKPACDSGMRQLADGCVPAKMKFHYRLGQSSIDKSQQQRLNQVVTLLKENKGVKLSIAGHTDSIGKRGRNQQLSKVRIEQIFDYLAEKGVDSNRISLVAYGESKPIASNATAAGRAENRRVEFNFEQIQEQSQGLAAAGNSMDSLRENLIDQKQSLGLPSLDNLLFHYDEGKYRLNDLQRQHLNQVAEVFQKNGDYHLTVVGHADAKGGKHRNQLLSIDRVDAVLRYLQNLGVDPSRISYVAYGETKPLASNQTARGRAQNRRVELNFERR